MYIQLSPIKVQRKRPLTPSLRTVNGRKGHGNCRRSPPIGICLHKGSLLTFRIQPPPISATCLPATLGTWAGLLSALCLQHMLLLIYCWLDHGLKIHVVQCFILFDFYMLQTFHFIHYLHHTFVRYSTLVSPTK